MDAPLRIAMVCGSYRPRIGGVETHVGSLVDALASQGVRVEVLTQDTDRRLPAVERGGHSVVIRRFRSFAPSQRDAQAPALWAWMARHNADYDLVHTHSYHAFVSMATSLAARRPLVFTPHYHGTGHSPLRAALHRVYRPLGRGLFAKATAVVCVSRAEAVLVAADFPDTPRKTHVIPNGVDVAAMRGAEPFPRDEPYFLSLGRLERYKRVDRVIEAMAEVPEPARLVVIGSGPVQPELLRLAAHRSVHRRIEFIDRVAQRDVARWIAGAQAVVSMSEHEAFGLTMLEGLAGGRNVVASDLPAHREVSAFGRRDAVELLPLNASTSQIAGALTRCMHRGRDLGRGEAVPSWDEVARRTLAVYHALVRRDAGRTQLAEAAGR